MSNFEVILMILTIAAKMSLITEFADLFCIILKTLTFLLVMITYFSIILDVREKQILPEMNKKRVEPLRKTSPWIILRVLRLMSR
jgi:hypothetical protein